MRLTFIGSGDAFGSGGRLQTCFHLDTGEGAFLVDCGATAMIGLNRLGLDANAISSIYISHLHGDHFAGLVWFLMHAHYVSRRTEPLLIAGPPGVEERYHAATEALFPGSGGIKRRHEVTFIEYDLEKPSRFGEATLTAYEVSHPSGAASCALRLEIGGKVLSYSGDTEWVESLIRCASGADLFIAECYDYDKRIPYHTSWATLASNLVQLGAKRVLVTHMNNAMLARQDEVRAAGALVAEDGLVIDI